MKRVLRLHRPLVAGLLLLGLGLSAEAQAQQPQRLTPPQNQPQNQPQTQGRGPAPRLTEAQQRKIFPETRSLAVRDHQARITILQQGERCSSAAGNGDALRACMRQERNAMQAQRQRHHEAMRQVFERNGIPVPDWSMRKGGGYGGPAGSPGGWQHPHQGGQGGDMPGGMAW
jgi:hypothetical protein